MNNIFIIKLTRSSVFFVITEMTMMMMMMMMGKMRLSRKRVELHINNHVASYKAAVSTQINENATKIHRITSYTDKCKCMVLKKCREHLIGDPELMILKVEIPSYLEIEVIRLG